jgi:iron complex outermembrane receptor protein
MRYKQQYGSLTVVICALLSADAWSQQQAGRFRQLEEVVVTARRVEESLQETPVAVSVFNAEEFVELRGAQDMTDVSIAPNVSITNSATPAGLNSAPQPFIRGLGQADFIIVTDPAVGIYLDGVYMARSVGSLMDFVDFDRIEVLRGPQGTLYGRNTIGGAINLISRRVGEEVGGRVSLSMGSDEFSELKAAWDVPFTIGNDAEGGARFSVLRKQREGYVQALQYDDLWLGNDDVSAMMASFEAATDSFQARMSLDYTREREAPTPIIVGEWGAPAYPADRPTTNSGELWYWNDSLYPGTCGDFDAVTGAWPAEDPICVGPHWKAPGTYQTNQTWHDEFGNLIEPEQGLNTYGISLNLTWDFEWGSFQSISGYRGLDADFINSFDQSPASMNTNHNIAFNQDQRSQEFQFTSSIGDRVDVTAGLYWFNEEAFENVLLLRGRVNPNGVNGGNIPPVAQTYLEHMGSIRFFENPRWIDNTSRAAYLQAVIHATDRLDVTVGARRTENNKSHAAALWFYTSILNGNVQGCEFDLSVGCRDTGGIGTQKAKETTPLLTVSYQISDDAFVYGTYTEGFRDGGFPARFTGLNIASAFDNFTFGEEYVESIEFGYKADLLDGRMRANIAVFQTSYTDMQIAGTPRDECGVSIGDNFIYLPGTCTVDPDPLGTGGPALNQVDDIAGSVINAGEATIQGMEFELTYAVTDNFRLDLALGYLDAQMDCINVYTSSQPSGECRGDGEISLGRDDVGVNASLPRTPEWDINLGFNYSANLQGGELLTRFDWHSVDEHTFSLTDNPFDPNRTPGYDIVNASATWYPANADWSVTFGGRNLTDELYYNNYDFSGNCACYQGNVNRPRTWYGTFRYNF